MYIKAIQLYIFQFLFIVGYYQILRSIPHARQ